MNRRGERNRSVPGAGSPEIDVVIPTWRRPGYLEGAIEGLLEQTRQPRRIIPVARPDDAPTWKVLDRLSARCEGRGIRLHPVEVIREGFLAPLIRAQREGENGIVVLHDDDGRAESTFLELLASHYEDEQVVGVGGRCIGYSNGELLSVPSTRRAAYFSWLGHPVGRMDRPMLPERAIRADFLIGGASSYRWPIFRRLRFPRELDNDVAVSYEVVIGAQARRLGRLVYEPAAVLHHFTGPREAVGLRPEGAAAADTVKAARRQALWNTSFAYQYGAPAVRRRIGFVVDLLIGTSLGPGIAYGALRPGRPQAMPWTEAAKIKWSAARAAGHVRGHEEECGAVAD